MTEQELSELHLRVLDMEARVEAAKSSVTMAFGNLRSTQTHLSLLTAGLADVRVTLAKACVAKAMEREALREN